MLKDNGLIGAIVIYRQEVRPFADKQIELVQNFAAQAVIAIENTRLLNELRESLQQQTATADVLKVISRSTFDLQIVLDTLAESAAQLCEAYDSIIYLRHAEFLRASAHYGPVPLDRSDADGSKQGLPLGRGWVSGRAVVDRAPVHINDLQASAAEFPDGSKVARTILAVPLLRQNEAIGVLTIRRLEVKPFTDKQIELVTTFADQAVIAIENARLFDEVQARTRELSESLEQQTATSEVLSVISSSVADAQPVFEIIAKSVARLCGSRFCHVYRFDGELIHFAATYGYEGEAVEALQRGYPIPPGRTSAASRAILNRAIEQIPDVQADPEYQHGDYARIVNFRSILAVPMLKGGQPVGAIAIARPQTGHFPERQVELVSNFAKQAVIAIENARLLNELHQRTDDLSEALEQQTATSEVLKVISSSTGELQLVFQALLENATRLCAAKFGNLYLCEGDAFRTVAMHNVPPAFAEVRRRNPLVRPGPGGTLDQLRNSKNVVHTPDVTTTKGYIERQPMFVTAVELGGFRSLLAVPMLKDGNLIGAIIIYRQETGTFSDKQIELVKNFAAQAVIAIENARLLNELRESLQQQTATADVLKVISRSAFDLKTVLDTLLRSAGKLCDADMGVIARRQEDVFFRTVAYGLPNELSDLIEDQPVELSRSSGSGRALLEGHVIQIDDIEADTEYTHPSRGMGAFRTLLGVPMMRDGVPVGVLTLMRKNVQPFADKQIQLISTFADQAAIAIENVRLFESVEARTRELAASLENLRTTQDRLVQTQKLASLGQLTAGIAHEIKNPLNFVNNFSGISAELITELQEALADVSVNEKRRSEITELMDTLRGNLDKIVQHGKRADAIVKNMLLHSREGSGEHRVIEINSLVEESLNLAYHGARAEKQGFNINLERSLDPAAGEADVFPQDITRALLNLISNGFYAATKRGAEGNGRDYEPTLAAATKNLGDRVEITIRDNGSGIPPEVKEKMFNPFFTTKPAGEGTGLGLSISHDIIVKQHGGSIEVDTQPGEFTEIRVILPRVAVLV
jgi:GAF domain-containing protein